MDAAGGAGTRLTVADLSTVITQVWTAYLSADGDCPVAAPDEAAAVPVTASVAISGGWTGHLVIGYSVEAATAVATAMLDRPSGRVTGDEIADAIGELANVVAGNIKAMLPSPTVHGLPAVHVGANCEIRFPGTTRTHHMPTRWHGEPVTFSLLADGRGKQPSRDRRVRRAEPHTWHAD
jgi:chemotaxis protein CheX